MPAMPGIPPVPQPIGPGQTAPAAPMTPQRAGDDARQNVLMGLALWIMSKAHDAAPLSASAPDIAATMGKLGKRFQPPQNDIGRSEFEFLKSQYNPIAPQAPQKPGMPPVPPQVPMAAPPAEMAAQAA